MICRRFALLMLVPLLVAWPQVALAQTSPALSTTPSGSPAPPTLQELRERIIDLERQLGALKQLVAQADLQSEKLAAAGRDAAATPTVEERLEALDQRLRVFAREDELRREAQAEQARVAPVVAAGRDGFQLRSSDGHFALRLRGLTQSDARFFANDARDAVIDSFALRRVRPILEGTLFKNFDVRFTPDFGNGTTVVQDAYIDLRFTTALRIRAGKQKQPFGIERLVSASDLMFTERGLTTTVAGNRDVGAMLFGDVLSGRVSYFAGVFNGVVDGGSGDLDDRDGKDLVARFFAHPFRTSANERLQGLGIGVAASHGSQRGTAAAPGVASYRSAGQQTYFRFAGDGTAAGTTVADGDRRRIAAQGYYYAGRFGLLAEHVSSSQQLRRGVNSGEARVRSWIVAPTWVLSGERASYRGVTPRTSLDRANQTWGAFELTARYNELVVGDEVFPMFANPVVSSPRARGGAVGLNWYLNRNIKAVFDYEETHFKSAGASSRRAERGLLSRVQLSF